MSFLMFWIMSVGGSSTYARYQILLSMTYNHFHILRLFDVLPNFPFTTRETIGDYYL